LLLPGLSAYFDLLDDLAEGFYDELGQIHFFLLIGRAPSLFTLLLPGLSAYFDLLDNLADGFFDELGQIHFFLLIGRASSLSAFDFIRKLFGTPVEKF